MRERLRGDAEARYDLLIGAIISALEAETTRYGTCSCGKRVPVTFPDIAARTKAVDMLITQGYGRPVEQSRSLHVSASLDELRQLDDGALASRLASLPAPE